MSASITNPLARALAADRPRFNSKFAAARRYHPQLEAAAFAEYLRTTLAPLIQAVDEAQPARTSAVVEALYDLSLDLLSQDLLGARSRYPHIVEGWRRLLPRLARFVAEAPGATAGAVTNALYNLSTTSGARPHEWAAAMLALSEVCSDVETLRRAGQVAAWRAGMAHYRPAALELCGMLNLETVRAALGLPKSANLPSVLERLRADPWFDPAASDGRPSELKIVGRAGAFRGFGGLFLAPPTVTCVAGQFIVSDGADPWLLSADRFGAAFHRADHAASPDKPRGAFALETGGRVTHGKQSRQFSEFESATSWAANENTLAVTTELSHAVYLVALA